MLTWISGSIVFPYEREMVAMALKTAKILSTDVPETA